MYTAVTPISQDRPSSYSHTLSVVRRPNASDAGLSAPHGLVGTPQLVAAGIPQQFHLLQNFIWSEVSDADRLRSAIDVVPNGDGVLAGSRRDGNFDLWVVGCELGQERLDETAKGSC